MSPEFLKYLLLGVVVFGFVFGKILSFRNVRRPVPMIPKTLEGHLDREKLLESKAYQQENFRFGLVSGALSFLVSLMMIYMGWFGSLDAWVGDLVAKPMIQSLLFFGVIMVASDLLSIPFEYYSTFVIEEKYGFNKTTLGIFIGDKVKGLLLTVVIGGGLLWLFLWLIGQMGQDFWWIFWLVAAGLMVLVNFFYTSWILPLFNKLTPLEEGELKAKIMEYADSVAFPLDNVFVMDGSKRSAKANAFFSGFGKKKKVVLFDTLIEQHSQEELVAVLAHEVGHFKKKHIVWSMLSSVVQVGLILFVLSRFIYSENMSLALGATEWSIQLNLIAFALLFSPISMVIGIGMNVISRKNEFQADAFAKETYSGKPLAEALKTLSVKTLSSINPDPAYVFVNYSHPPLLDRLERLENNDQ